MIPLILMPSMKFIIKILINSLAIFMASALLPGIHVRNMFIAIIVSVVLAILNAIVKPILIFLTLPITLLSLGFFLLVINASVILLADKLIDGFQVDGFWWALLFSIVVFFMNAILESFAGAKKTPTHSN